MAFNRKNWQDNVSDITAAELNRMEQGIYDNSLVVDAVTNTLNPTDTETYKIAELTEGQITDVIGVSDILIKGQTSQDGEPTPDSPVDVNVVSGSNVVNIKSKNLININKLTPGYVLGTGGFSTQSTNEEMYSEFIKVLPNTQYTFKIFETTWNGFNSSNWIGIGEYRDAQVNSFIQRDVMGTGTQKYYAITTTANTNYIVVSARGLVSATKIQLEIGSTATDYTPYYQGKELPLDLPVENLYNPNYRYEEKVRCTNGTATEENGVFTLTATGNDLYMWNVSTEGNSYAGAFGELYEFEEDVYSVSITNNKMATNLVSFYDENKISLGYIPKLSNPFTVSKLEKSGAKYFSLRIGNNKAVANETYKFSVQLEKGSKANAYTPYGTEPIELCKIGDYQDYFYKSGSKWYLHKEINKDIIDENSTINITNSGTDNWFYSIKIEPMLTTKDQVNQICNYYPIGAVYAGNTDVGIMKTTNGQEIRIRYGTQDTVANFKTWLASNNVVLYFLLQNPTDTEITDTTLISQLEAIYNAPLYEQTNITQTNNDLPMVLDITACKDNINGIKAFIRK